MNQTSLAKNYNTGC